MAASVCLSVGDGTQSQCSPAENDTDGGSSNNGSGQKSHESSAHLTVAGSQPESGSPALHEPSPTYRALQEMEAGVSSGDNQSAARQTVKDDEETRYRANPKQSRSFQMLQQGLKMSESGQGGSAESSPAVPSGIRSVKAPVFDPSQHETQQAQYMTCQVCGMLITGVFVRIKGEPLHPDCFKCVKCGKNLKNQGYFMIDGQMHCEADARQVSQPAGQDAQAVPVYR